MRDGRQLLIIDDDRAIVEALTVRLEAAGYKVAVAFDGQQGLELAEANRPDGIVLDVRMPGIDGLVTLSHLRESKKTRDAAVVVLSASTVDSRRALAMGADYFLGKPYTSSALLSAMETAIAERHPKGALDHAQA